MFRLGRIPSSSDIRTFSQPQHHAFAISKHPHIPPIHSLTHSSKLVTTKISPPPPRGGRPLPRTPNRVRPCSISVPNQVISAPPNTPAIIPVIEIEDSDDEDIRLVIREAQHKTVIEVEDSDDEEIGPVIREAQHETVDEMAAMLERVNIHNTAQSDISNSANLSMPRTNRTKSRRFDDNHAPRHLMSATAVPRVSAISAPPPAYESIRDNAPVPSSEFMQLSVIPAAALGGVRSTSMQKAKYYVVTIGKCAGIFYDIWDNVSVLTFGVSGSRYRGCKTYGEARRRYDLAKQNNEIIIERNPGNEAIFGPRTTAIQ
ncbi:hypothetical protein BJ912DRAFT_920885 [Pholiota molesta]|nr:hypothetical protein BJ912DRAFT_920885 [Pholiota molesta]